MISMQTLNGGLVALASLVVAAVALAALIMAAPRVSQPGQAPRGGTRPDLSPEPWPDLDDGRIVVPDDARELTEDRELAPV